MKRPVCVSIAVAGMLGAFLVLGIPPSSAQEVAQASSKDLVLRDDAQCTRCHDDESSPRVISIGKTKHGTRADNRTPTCINCHGASESHLRGGQGGAARPKPDRVFGHKSTTAPEARTDTCLACHSGRERMFWASGTHAARDVTCDSCHEVHNNGIDKVRERMTQTDVCFTCHKEKRVQIGLPSRHPIREGKVTCSDCHNPHGSAGPKNLVRDTVNETCFKCHAEKRGPFIWNHYPVTENCSLCHEPHGTTVASLLKFRSPFLCQQCHESTTHRGAVPSFTDTAGTASGQRVLFAQGCLNCHINIHGSNNPTPAANSRRLRQ